MSHYSCKTCGLRYDDCRCVPSTSEVTATLQNIGRCRHCGAKYEYCECHGAPPRAAAGPRLASEQMISDAREYREAYNDAVERACAHIWLGLKEYGNPDMVFVQVRDWVTRP